MLTGKPGKCISLPPEWSFRLSLIEGVASSGGQGFPDEWWRLSIGQPGLQYLAGKVSCKEEDYLTDYFSQERHTTQGRTTMSRLLGLLCEAEHNGKNEAEGLSAQLFYRRIAKWAAAQLTNGQWTLSQWKSYYWQLSTHLAQQAFREALLQAKPEWGKHIADTYGSRPATTGGRLAFYQQLNSLQQEQKSPVVIRWLAYGEDGSYRIRENYLRQEYARLLFEEDGQLRQEARELQGRSLVKCLKGETNEAIAYIKFYPHYPLRQYAIESLCARLGGYAAQTTLACLRHHNKKEGYPVLLSMPTGESLLTHHLQSSDVYYESRCDRESFTWKFFEALLMLPKDDKHDNIAPVKVLHSSHYAWVSFDSDECFVHEAATKASLSVYTMIWLMDGMNEPLDETAVSGFLHRDWDTLLRAWLGDVEVYSQATEVLFTKDELKEYERLRSTGSCQPRGFDRSYNVFCDVESLFRSNDIPALYQQIQRLRAVLEKYRHKKDAGLSHWRVLESMSPALALHYRQAFGKGTSAVQRFEHLPGLEEHFDKRPGSGLRHSLTAVAPESAMLLWASDLPQVLERNVFYLVLEQINETLSISLQVFHEAPQVLSSELVKALICLMDFPDAGTTLELKKQQLAQIAEVYANRLTNQAALIHASRQTKQPMATFFTGLTKGDYPFTSWRNVSEQVTLLQGIRGYCDAFHREFDRVQKEENIEVFKQDNYPSFLRERIINQLHWEALSRESGEKVLNAASGTVFHHLRLNQLAWLTTSLLESLLAFSPQLSQLQLCQVALSNENLGTLFTSCPQLHSLEISSSQLKYITTWSGIGNVDLPCLQKLVLQDCGQLLRVEINCPELRELEITGCWNLSKNKVEYFIKNTPLLIKVTLDDVGWDLNQVKRFNFEKLKELSIPVTEENRQDTTKALLRIHETYPRLKKLQLQGRGLLDQTLKGHSAEVWCVTSPCEWSGGEWFE